MHHRDQLLEAVEAGGLPGTGVVVYHVGDGHFVQRRQVAFPPGFFNETLAESFVVIS